MNPDPAILAQATERLNEALREAEDAIGDLNLAVCASVPLDDLGRTLQFRKVANAFQLMVEIKPGELQPLVKASRQLRIRAAAKVGALRDALGRSYEEEVERVNAATATVMALVRMMRAESKGVP